MKTGDLVYVPRLKKYGFIKEMIPGGRIVSIHSMNPQTGRFDVIQVIDLIVEAVGLIKRFIVIAKMLFTKPKVI